VVSRDRNLRLRRWQAAGTGFKATGPERPGSSRDRMLGRGRGAHGQRQPRVIDDRIGLGAVNPVIIWSRPGGGYDELDGE
jgi:hypothetical protein